MRRWLLAHLGGVPGEVAGARAAAAYQRGLKAAREPLQVWSNSDGNAIMVMTKDGTVEHMSPPGR